MTSSSTRTLVTPGTADTASVTRSVMAPSAASISAGVKAQWNARSVKACRSRLRLPAPRTVLA